MEKSDCIFVAGHRGLVGSAMCRVLRAEGYNNVRVVSRHEPDYPVDLRDPVATRWWFSSVQPRYVFLCAARVGGIKANIKNPIDFFLDNIAIQRNVMENAAHYGCEKLVFLGSSCIYPKNAPQPIKEESLLTGPLEPTNEGYALAKIAGVKMCQWYQEKREKNFVAVMPCNLYGPNDNFSAEDGHLVPGLIARMHAAKIAGDPEFSIWGDGTARREILYSDDLAKALMVVMEKYNSPEPINTGSGKEYAVWQIAQAIQWAVGYQGRVVFDPTQPVGVQRKLMDNSKIFSLGWCPTIREDWALRTTYEDFLKGHRDVLTSQ